MARGWSCRELDRQANLVPGSAANIESERKPNPTYETIRALARALDCGFDDLLSKDSVPPPAASDVALPQSIEEPSIKAG